MARRPASGKRRLSPGLRLSWKLPQWTVVVLGAAPNGGSPRPPHGTKMKTTLE